MNLFKTGIRMIFFYNVRKSFMKDKNGEKKRKVKVRMDTREE